MSYKLFDHQKKMLEILTENDRFLLLPQTGTGKTLPAVIHMSNLYLAGEIQNALIVAPLSGLGAWSRDIKKLTPERQELIWKHTRCINYAKLSRNKGRYQKECWQQWDLIMLDEGHAIAKPTSNRTKYFVGRGKTLGLASKAQYRYIITGTLINNSRLEDIWSPLRFLYDEDWMTWADFKRKYLVMRNLPGSYAQIVVGYRHRAELLDLVGSCSYRVLKKDCLDLPEVMSDEIIKVPFAAGKNTEPFVKTTKALYEDALDSYVEALDMVMDNPLTRLLRMRQIATGHIKESDTGDETGRRMRGKTYPLKSHKAKYVMELIENNQPYKTVVFYNFRATCLALEKALKSKGVKYVTLNGDQKNKNIWQDFQADDSIKVIVVQYQSGSRAIDLFASSYTIYVEPTDSSEMMEQSRARTDRFGQTEACNYVFLLTEGSVEEDMYKKLAGHQDFAERSYREITRSRVKGAK
ncbi:MAG: DEAD/DEAH box helicase [Deltaproteobacteria bacterium]|nr:DEAD/DEAH box helicase [Deltaproteobacteria bacterium]